MLRAGEATGLTPSGGRPGGAALRRRAAHGGGEAAARAVEEDPGHGSGAASHVWGRELYAIAATAWGVGTPPPRRLLTWSRRRRGGSGYVSRRRRREATASPHDIAAGAEGERELHAANATRTQAKDRHRFQKHDDGYRVPDAYEDRPKDQSLAEARESALNQRYEEEDEPLTEQELWDQEQQRRAGSSRQKRSRATTSPTKIMCLRTTSTSCATRCC